MPIREGLDDNLRFLIHEVHKQVERTKRYVAEPSELLASRVQARDDYIDNLKNVIQRKTFRLAAAHAEDKGLIRQLRCLDIIASNLEQIADFCEDVISQLAYAEGPVLGEFDWNPFFAEVFYGLERIERAFFNRHLKTALEICKAEDRLDDLYHQAFKDGVARLEAGRYAQGYVTALFIAHYFERMGDKLLNIGEAAISVVIGESIKISQFHALSDSLHQSGLQEGIQDIQIQAAGETRSGARIDRVRKRGGDRLVIFKDGHQKKVAEERDALTRWQTIAPGLAPQVLSYEVHGNNAALLIEYLPGRTFDELLIGPDEGAMRHGLDRLLKTVASVWRSTREEITADAQFMGQLRSRLGDVISLHPGFDYPALSIGALQAPSFRALVNRAGELEARLSAPFSVLIHGDFNVDNVICDETSDAVRFIDLHRSRMMDYVQDVSVFMVSCFRLRVFDPQIRRRIRWVMKYTHARAAEFAAEQGDPLFEPRLALGLARSLATSARFVMEEQFAKAMFYRARYLLERLVEADETGTLDTYHVSVEDLVV